MATKDVRGSQSMKLGHKKHYFFLQVHTNISYPNMCTYLQVVDSQINTKLDQLGQNMTTD